MLNALTQRLSSVVKTLRGHSRITEDNVQEMLREVRLALLDADAGLPVVKDFVGQVKERALGQDVVGSLTPGQALVGVVYQELVGLMGGQSAGLDLGVANAISMLVWLTVAIYWLGGLAFQGLSSVLGLMAPVALAAVLFQATTQTRHVVTYGGNPLFTLHFAIALLAYSLFTVATVHALVMLAEEKWLHRGVLPPFLKELPPLLQMEALLFRILLAAFVLLTAATIALVIWDRVGLS